MSVTYTTDTTTTKQASFTTHAVVDLVNKGAEIIQMVIRV